MFDLVPFRRRTGQLRRTEDPFENFFSNFFNLMDDDRVGFRTDVKEKEKEFVLEAELPGMKKEDINISLEDGYLTVSAENNEVIEEEKDNYIRRERRMGSYCRSFRVENIKEDEIKASYEDGILKLILPREKPAPVDKRRVIDIE